MNMIGILSRPSFLLMIGLGLWVSVVAGVIEGQNARADYYLPRQDRYDGKWRVSVEGTPRDRLRDLVSGVGLFQYLLAPLCIAMGAVHACRESAIWRRRVAVVVCGTGAMALALAVYRGYFESLSW